MELSVLNASFRMDEVILSSSYSIVTLIVTITCYTLCDY